MRLDSIWLANFPAPDPVERLLAEVKEATEQKTQRIISGIASSEIVDRSGQVVDYKSLKKAGRSFMKRRNRPMYWNHGWWMPIGRVLSMAFDDEKKLSRFSGLIAEGYRVPVAAGTMRFSTQLMDLEELWSVIQQDMAPADSIAFIGDIEEGEKDKETGLRPPPRIVVNDLLEISVVTLPANSEAEFSISRALDDPMFVASIEAGLRSGFFNLDERSLDLTIQGTDSNSGWKFEDSAETDRVGREGVARESAADEWARIVEEVEKCRTSLRTMSSS